jgi:hypothetical protein
MRKYLILLLLCLSVSLSFAQESTEAPAESTAEAATTSPEVTTEVTEVLAPTQAAPAAPTNTPIAYSPAPEPTLSLWASDNFEGAVSPRWTLPQDWLGNGTSLNIASTNSGFFSSESFSEVAVQAQFKLSAGASVSVFLRNSYRASLNSEGRLSLWRDDKELATTTITINHDGHFLRLSAFGDALRLGLDGQMMLVVQDASYSTGQIGVRAELAEAGLVTLDNFGVWIPTSMMPAPNMPVETDRPADANIQVLAPPALLAPALNGIVTTLKPTFSWQPRAGAVQYRLLIASNFSCSTIISGGEVFTTTTSYIPTTNIPQGEYWFCVEAKDNTNTWSGFGEKRRFVINLSKTPLNLSVNTLNKNATLTWTAVVGASYDVEIASDSSFSIVPYQANGLTTASYAVTNLPYGQYFWRVAVNGNQLPMSLARSFYISPPLPTAALNALPLNNGKFTNNINPTLNWTVPSNWQTPQAGQSVTYELQLSTNVGFTALVAPSVTGIPTNNYQWTATNLADGRYYWRVRARTNLGLFGAWSAAFYFNVDTVPQAEPNYIAPANLAFVPTARPSFTWGVVVGATRYELQVSELNDFSTTTISVTQVTTAYLATSSLAQGNYFWRVRSIDAAGNYSLVPATVRSFTVDYRTSPTAEQVFVSALPRTMAFRWTLVAGATGAIYTVELDDDINFGSIDHSSPALSVGSWISPQLAQGRYYWRLVVAGYGTTAARAFVISPALPNAPLQTSPINNAQTNDVSPTLQWNIPTLNNSSITGYDVQVSTNGTFTALVGGTNPVAANSYTIFPDLPLTAGTTYYWRVRAVTNLGATGVWSVARYFRLDTTAPSLATLVSPINGADVSIRTPLLRWTAVLGATRYELRYGANSDLSAVTPILLTLPSYTISPALPLGTFYWEVRALDAAGNVGAWTGVEDFDVVSLPTAVSSPWYFTTATPTLSWSPLYWAGQYEIQVSTTSTFSILVFTTTVGSSATSVETTSLPDGVYYFRVRGINQPEAGAGAGSWSLAETFSIDLP